LFLFVLCGCKSIPRHCLEADRISTIHINQVRKSDNLEVMGTGGRLMNDVQGITLVYTVNRIAKLQDARNLYVKTTSSLIDLINNDEKIRPYMHEYPFNIDNVEVGIVFTGNGDIPAENYVSMVTVNHHTVFYFYWNGNSHKPLYNEPWEEAVRLVNATGN
jgi:hypothetical protein